MNVSDPIADMLTRIRNASRARHEEVLVPASRTKLAIARILKDEGFIEDFSEFQEGPRTSLKIRLRYVGKVPVVSGLKRVSKPGLRVYAAKTEIPRVLGGLGRRHRQHQPGDHDRTAGPQGPARRRESWPTSGRSPCPESVASHPRAGRCGRHHRWQPCGRQGPAGRASRVTSRPSSPSSVRTARCASSARTTSSAPASCTG